MEWYQVIISIAGGIGGVGGIYTLFTMKLNKEGLAIKNLKEVIEEMKNNHSEYKTNTDNEIADIKLELSIMKKDNELKTMAINKGYRCPFPPRETECPVTKTMDASIKSLKQ